MMFTYLEWLRLRQGPDEMEMAVKHRNQREWVESAVVCAADLLYFKFDLSCLSNYYIRNSQAHSVSYHSLFFAQLSLLFNNASMIVYNKF